MKPKKKTRKRIYLYREFGESLATPDQAKRLQKMIIQAARKKPDIIELFMKHIVVMTPQFMKMALLDLDALHRGVWDYGLHPADVIYRYHFTYCDEHMIYLLDKARREVLGDCS